MNGITLFRALALTPANFNNDRLNSHYVYIYSSTLHKKMAGELAEPLLGQVHQFLGWVYEILCLSRKRNYYIEHGHCGPNQEFSLREVNRLLSYIVGLTMDDPFLYPRPEDPSKSDRMYYDPEIPNLVCGDIDELEELLMLSRQRRDSVRNWAYIWSHF